MSAEPKRVPREAFALASFLRAGAMAGIQWRRPVEIYKRPIPLDKGSTSQVRGHEQRSQGQCLAHRTAQMTVHPGQPAISSMTQCVQEVKVLPLLIDSCLLFHLYLNLANTKLKENRFQKASPEHPKFFRQNQLIAVCVKKILCCVL